MRRNLFLSLILIFLMFPGMIAFGQNPDGSPLLFDVEFDWLGLGVNLGYKGLSLSPAVDTIFHVIVIGSYDNPGFFREPDGSPYDGILPGYDNATSPYSPRFTASFSFEFDQGLVWHERDQRNALEFFLAYKLRFDKNIEDVNVNQLLFDSGLPDREGSLQNSFLIGLEWKDVDKTGPHRVFSGTAADVSAEWGPEFLFNTAYGHADFLRLNGSARAFLPVFDFEPGSSMNILSAYACFYAAVDYITGTSIPINVRGSFGGKYPRRGLGYAIRGLEDSRFDAPFKAVFNSELRINLPAVIDPSIIPGIIVFFDCGYYDFIDFPQSGLLFSTGGGIYLSLFDMVNLALTTHYVLNETKVTGERWTPVSFAFMFHF